MTGRRLNSPSPTPGRRWATYADALLVAAVIVPLLTLAAPTPTPTRHQSQTQNTGR